MSAPASLNPQPTHFWKRADRPPLPSAAVSAHFAAPGFQDSLGAARDLFRREWNLLAAERNPESFAQGLLVLGRRVREAEPSGPAGEIFQSALDLTGISAALRGRAEREWRVSQGQGSFVDRLPTLLPNLPRQALSWESLATLAGAGLMGRAVFAAGFSRFAGSASFVACGGKTGARAAAGFLALGAEASSFALLSRALGKSTPASSLGTDVASALVFLGLLRGAHLIGRRLAPTNAYFQAAATLTGAAGANRLLQSLELRPKSATDSLWLDSLASLASFYLAERSLNALSSGAYGRYLGELDARAAGQQPPASGFAVREGRAASVAGGWRLPRSAESSRIPAPPVLQMASLKGKTAGGKAKLTSAEKRAARREYLRESELLEGMKLKMEAATRTQDMPPPRALNAIRNPDLHSLAWLYRIENLVRLGRETAARASISRDFLPKKGIRLRTARDILITHLNALVESRETAAADTGQVPESAAPTTAADRPLVPPKPADDTLPHLLRLLGDKARAFGSWKLPEMMATKLAQRVAAIANPTGRTSAEGFLRETLLLVKQGTLGNSECFRVLQYFELTLDGKIDWQSYELALEALETGGLKSLANLPAVALEPERSPLLGAASLGVSDAPLAGKPIRSAGQLGMVEFVRRHHLLADWVRDEELLDIIRREAPSFAESLGGLKRRQFEEGVMADPPNSHATLAKRWNVGTGTVSGLLSARRKEFHSRLTRAIEELIQKNMKANQTM